jgi:hypothetical protein
MDAARYQRHRRPRPYAIDVRAEERAHGTPETADVESSAAPREEGQRPGAGSDREATTHDRCIHHPSKAAIARCDACGEPVCVTCAVPVRGRVLGPECLGAELGEPAITATPEPDRGLARSWVAIAGASLALAATAGPWTRTGAGDRLFGAWVPSFRWSMVAAVAAALLLPSVWWFRARGTRTGPMLAILGGTTVVAASVLAIAFPPTFQVASWGPWVAAIGGGIALAGGIASASIGVRPGQGV